MCGTWSHGRLDRRGGLPQACGEVKFVVCKGLLSCAMLACVHHASGAGSCQAPTMRICIGSNCVRTKNASSGKVPDMSLLSNSICRLGGQAALS